MNLFATAVFTGVTLLCGRASRPVAPLNGPSTTTYFKSFQSLSIKMHLKIAKIHIYNNKNYNNKL